MDSETAITQAGDILFFAGWRSDPFFFDVDGALNNLQFTGKDFFADKDICSIVIEVPNSALGPGKVGFWARTIDGTGGGKWATLLPDILLYDPKRAAAFPTNGRTLTDDVVDFFIPILTNGKVKGDKVGPHTDLLTNFPYVGSLHKAWSKELVAA